MWGQDWLRAGCQEVGKCSTRSGSRGNVHYVCLCNANKAAHSGFETQRRRHQKSITGVPVAPKMDMCQPKTFFKKRKERKNGSDMTLMKDLQINLLILQSRGCCFLQSLLQAQWARWLLSACHHWSGWLVYYSRFSMPSSCAIWLATLVRTCKN